MGFSVKILINESSDNVDKYMLSHGAIYHLTKWSEIIHQEFGHNCYYIYIENEQGGVCGVLPLVHINSYIFGNYMVSMPYFNYGGLVVDSDEIENMLFTKATELASKNNVAHIEYRETKSRCREWPVRLDKVNMILDLPETIDELAKNLGSKRRSQIKRSLKEGVNVIVDGVGLLDDFYSVFSENMRDLGTPVYPKSFFRTIFDNFPDNTRLVVLKLNDKAISAAFLIGYKDTLEIPWASTLSKYNSFSPNMLLYWEVLKLAIEEGYQKFDFGRSSVDSGTYKFKKQWGAKPKQLYWHYWLSDGMKMPKLTPDNPKYKLAISIWKKLPLWLCNFIGPKIVKNLP